jgi:succinyl-CoA synthetase beta subunit
VLDELEAYALLARVGIPHARAAAIRADGNPALPLAYPVAVKALSPQLTHKSDAGAVVLNVHSQDELIAAMRLIQKSVAERMPGVRIDRYLVQEMVSGVGEVLIGYRLDVDVGPLIMVAAGGILTELYRDRSIRLAPVDLATAREMISEVRGLAVLDGFRGKPKGDLDALAGAIVALSQLADDPAVLEAEVNPLIVRPAGKGVAAVDALARVTGKA